MVDNRTFAVTLAAIAVVAGGAALAVIGPGDFFVPETSTQENEQLATERPNATVLKTGSFLGQAGHDVSGQVSLVSTDDGLYLQFENYDQQQGPDVFIYVTPADAPESNRDIAEGRKVRIDGGADGGESTKEGTFIQKLPDDIDPSQINGVSAWCDQFSTPFGAATLEPVSGS